METFQKGQDEEKGEMAVAIIASSIAVDEGNPLWIRILVGTLGTTLGILLVMFGFVISFSAESADSSEV